MAILPVLGEYEMSTDLFRYTRSFWRPTAAVVALYGTALYVKSSILYSLGLKAAAILIYSIFLIRLYYRLARQFGKSRLFAVAMVLMPYLFLAILAFGRSVYLGKKEFAPTPLYSPAVRWLRRAGVVLTAVAEVLIVGGACFLITYIARPIRPIAAYDAYRYIRDFSKLRSL